MPLLVSQINLYPGLSPLRLCLCSAAFINCVTSDVTGSVSKSLIRLGTHHTLLFHLTPHRWLVLSHSWRSMMRWERAAALFTKKWHSAVHQLPTWILIGPRYFFLSVIFLTPSQTQHACHLLVPHSSSSSSFHLPFFHPFLKSLHLNLPHSSHMSALTMPPLLCISFLLNSFLLPICTFLHPSFLFGEKTGVTSDLFMYHFVWTGNSLFFSLSHVSSHHTITFIFILHASDPPCVLFWLFFCLFSVVPSPLASHRLSSSFSFTLGNIFLCYLK